MLAFAMLYVGWLLPASHEVASSLAQGASGEWKGMREQKQGEKNIFTALKFTIFPNMMVVLSSTGRDCSSRIGQDIWYIRL